MHWPFVLGGAPLGEAALAFRDPSLPFRAQGEG